MPDPAASRVLGKTTVEVSRLGLGTAPLGGLFASVTEADAVDTVGKALSLGLRYFDTAPLYGSGTAETRLGRGLAGAERDRVVISTKVGRLLRAGAPIDQSQYHQGVPFFKDTLPLNPIIDFTYDGVIRSVEESLERLNLGRVDVLLIHDPDDHYAEAADTAYRALDRLRREGAVSAIGVGMNQPEMLERFVRELPIDCILIAGRYTLLDQAALDSLLPTCFELNVSVIIGGIYNSGILADPRRRSTFNYVPAPPQVLERVARIEAICREYDVPLKAAAVQFPLQHPAVACVLVGARSPQEVEENVEMFRYSVPAGLWTELKARGLLPEGAPT